MKPIQIQSISSAFSAYYTPKEIRQIIDKINKLNKDYISDLDKKTQIYIYTRLSSVLNTEKLSDIDGAIYIYYYMDIKKLSVSDNLKKKLLDIFPENREREGELIISDAFRNNFTQNEIKQIQTRITGIQPQISKLDKETQHTITSVLVEIFGSEIPDDEIDEYKRSLEEAKFEYAKIPVGLKKKLLAIFPMTEKEKVEKKLGPAFDCDMRWVTLMNNKIIISDIVNYMIKEAGRAKDSVFRGSAIIGDRDTDLSNLLDVQTIDLIAFPFIQVRQKYPVEEKLKDQAGKNAHKDKTSVDELKQSGLEPQQVYPTVHHFFETNPPLKNKVNIYYFGHAHGEGKHVDIHWNCLIVDMKNNTYFMYDPSDEQGPDQGYNFDSIKKRIIFEGMTAQVYDVSKTIPKNVTTLPPSGQRAQQFCAAWDDKYGIVADVFCQSWVLVFTSAYLNGVVDEFFSIDFRKAQMMIVKVFFSCLLSRMSVYYKGVIKEKEYASFFKVCRQCDEKKCVLKKVLPIIPTGKKKLPCIVSIVRRNWSK